MSADTITAEQLTAIKAYATECAVSFVDEFPGEQLTDSDDWDSAAPRLRFATTFSIFRRHLVAEISRLNLERLQATLTQVQLPELRSTDLRASSRSHVEYECYRSSETVGADAIEIVFVPEINRAGVAAGSDAQWTDASSAADALRRFLNDDMSP
mgnify:CR=1 FL=1